MKSADYSHADDRMIGYYQEWRARSLRSAEAATSEKSCDLVVPGHLISGAPATLVSILGAKPRFYHLEQLPDGDWGGTETEGVRPRSAELAVYLATHSHRTVETRELVRKVYTKEPDPWPATNTHCFKTDMANARAALGGHSVLLRHTDGRFALAEGSVVVDSDLLAKLTKEAESEKDRRVRARLLRDALALAGPLEPPLGKVVVGQHYAWYETELAPVVDPLHEALYDLLSPTPEPQQHSPLRTYLIAAVAAATGFTSGVTMASWKRR